MDNGTRSGLTQGAQVVTRVAAVLRAVGQYSSDGVTTARVAQLTALNRSTTHRLLTSLFTEGFIDRDVRLARWYPGPELFLLGSSAAGRYDIADIAGESVQTLAAQTGESAFLSARRGGETVCLMREEGSFPIRSFVLYEGARFPLGVVSAGLAILSYFPDNDIDSYLDRAQLQSRFGESHSPAEVWMRIARTRETGYSVNPGLIVEGSWGMAATIFDESNKPSWALSITGIESRFRPERQVELGALLLEQAHVVTQRLQGRQRYMPSSRNK
jgi:DNA-binding IclR family transcriptional regulator